MRPGVHDHLGRRVVADLDRPGLGRVPAQVALPLEHGEVGVDGGRGGQSDRLADLADRRRVAAVADRLGDAVEDLLPLGAQYLGHGSLRCPVRRAVTPWPSHPAANVCLHERSPLGPPKANICSKKSIDTEHVFVVGWPHDEHRFDARRPGGGSTAVRVSHRAVHRPYNDDAHDGDDRKDLPMTALLTASLPEYLDDEPVRPDRPELRLVQAPAQPGLRLRPRSSLATRRMGPASARPRRRVPLEVRRRRTLLAMMGLALALLALPLGGFGGASHTTESAFGGQRPPRDLHGAGRRHPLVDRPAGRSDRATRRPHRVAARRRAGHRHGRPG